MPAANHKGTVKPAASISSYFQNKLAHNYSRSKAITDAIGYFICKDMRLYNVAENAGFRHMIATLELRYTIPNREHFMESLSGPERVALTTDGWTSCASQSYIIITVHYITADWSIKNHVLQTRLFYEAHTGKKHCPSVARGMC